jgi:hypothetical protein
MSCARPHSSSTASGAFFVESIGVDVLDPLLQKALMTCKRAFAAQAPERQKAASKHGDVEGAEADEQDQLLIGRLGRRRQAIEARMKSQA